MQVARNFDFIARNFDSSAQLFLARNFLARNIFSPSAQFFSARNFGSTNGHRLASQSYILSVSVDSVIEA
jgi:hypothetical protein